MDADQQTTNLIVAIITALTGLVTSLATLIVSLHNTRKIQEVHTATNSMKDELVKTTREKSLLEGHEAGRIAGVADEKARQNEAELKNKENSQ